MAPPLDTSIIVRGLVNDSPQQAENVQALFRQLAIGSEELLLTEGVLVEAVQVLSSRTLCNVPRPDIVRDLTRIISLEGIRMAEKARYMRALDLYADFSRLDFVDALLIAYAEQEAPPTVVSFDAEFDRVPGVVRLEPPPPREMNGHVPNT